ncbi:MAG TPA: hypothetical protein VE604_13670 [Candidatus Polarisedimenticolia bacterium]|jgi:hypothetical protein|nr:hypothetical protein [Candidatus Polarisedimenticolia bacterium]
MDADLKKKLQISLLVFVAIAVVRVGFIFYARRDTGEGPKKAETTYSSNMDDYVTPHKIFPYNVESAKKELVGKPMWVKTGNVLPYFPYDVAAHTVNFKQKTGLLPPVAKLQVKDVVLAREPVSLKPGEVAVIQKKIMAVFEKPGEQGSFAVAIGSNTGDDYTFTTNDMFFFEDPHQLYKHWPAETWSAIDQHQAKQGMSELQAAFALGANISSGEGDYGNRTIEFVNAGKPVTVVFEKNKATSVTPGKAQ